MFAMKDTTCNYSEDITFHVPISSKTEGRSERLTTELLTTYIKQKLRIGCTCKVVWHNVGT